MLERRVPILNALGLHARAAAQLVRLANRFRSRIILTREDTGVTANAKSILSVLNIAAAYGCEIRVTAEGDDEAAAVDAIVDLIMRGFGEI